MSIIEMNTKFTSIPCRVLMRKSSLFFSLSDVSGVNCIRSKIPSAPANGGMTCTDGLNYDSDCTFSCNVGYALDPASPSTWTCLATGDWSVAGDEPTCLGKY